MKNLPKILKTIFLIIFIFQMIGLIFLLATPNLTKAADPIKFIPQVGIPGSKIFSTECIDKCNTDGGSVDVIKKCKDKCGIEVSSDVGGKKQSTLIGEYISAIYKYAIGIVGILAAVVLMIGGVIWLTAGGNQTRISEAKAWIGASLTGLIIALSSYMILATINPDLVNFKPIVMPEVENQNGCCSAYNGNIKECTNLGEKSCKASGNEWMQGGVCTSGVCVLGVCCLEYIPGSSDAMWCEMKLMENCTKEKSSYTGASVYKVDPSSGICNKFTKGILNIPYYNCK